MYIIEGNNDREGTDDPEQGQDDSAMTWREDIVQVVISWI